MNPYRVREDRSFERAIGATYGESFEILLSISIDVVTHKQNLATYISSRDICAHLKRGRRKEKERE